MWRCGHAFPARWTLFSRLWPPSRGRQHQRTVQASRPDYLFGQRTRAGMFPARWDDINTLQREDSGSPYYVETMPVLPLLMRPLF